MLHPAESLSPANGADRSNCLPASSGGQRAPPKEPEYWEFAVPDMLNKPADFFSGWSTELALRSHSEVEARKNIRNLRVKAGACHLPIASEVIGRVEPRRPSDKIRKGGVSAFNRDTAKTIRHVDLNIRNRNSRCADVSVFDNPDRLSAISCICARKIAGRCHVPKACKDGCRCRVIVVNPPTKGRVL